MHFPFALGMRTSAYPRSETKAAFLDLASLHTQTDIPVAVAVQREQRRAAVIRFAFIYLLKFIQDKVEHKSSSRQGLNYWFAYNNSSSISAAGTGLFG